MIRSRAMYSMPRWDDTRKRQESTTIFQKCMCQSQRDSSNESSILGCGYSVYQQVRASSFSLFSGTFNSTPDIKVNYLAGAKHLWCRLVRFQFQFSARPASTPSRFSGNGDPPIVTRRCTKRSTIPRRSVPFPYFPFYFPAGNQGILVYPRMFD